VIVAMFRNLAEHALQPATPAVIAWLDRAIQYSRDLRLESRSRGVLDCPG
jgi:hypothetical protein